MAEIYKPNVLDKEFDEFWSRVNCFAMLDFPYDQRCEFVRNANNCIHGTNFVPYMHLLACEFKCRNVFQEYIFVTLFLILCFELLLFLSHVAHYYYTPALTAISRMLHMNEHLAGVTIMALGNTLPDMFANMCAIYDEIPIFGNCLSSALFVTMFTGGLVCYLSPFQMSGYNTVCDLLFFIFGAMLLEFFIISENGVSIVECIVMIALYVIYITVNVLDVYFLKRTLHCLRREINEMYELPQSEEVKEKRRILQKKYDILSQNNRVTILQRKSYQNDNRTFSFLTKVGSERVTIDMEANRNIYYTRDRSKNHHLFREFFSAIQPIKLNEWRQATMLVRAYYIARAPVVFLSVIYIPLVDYELKKNGWSKLLNCIQIFLNPAFTITMGKAMLFTDKSKLWYYNIPHDVKYGLYSLVVTVPIAIAVFFHSNTSVPPPYHWLFTIMNLTGSMFAIFQSATEITLITGVLGFMLKVPPDFMGATVSCVATSLSDLITNASMAMQGYEKMAYAAAIGGPFFSVLLGTCSVIAVKILLGLSTSMTDLIGSYGENAFVLLILGLLSTLLWTSVLNFNARRSVGIFSMSIYGLYIIYSILIRFRIIHPYGVDILLTSSHANN
ncbi:putative sodium/calcium exchanger 7 [Drosophila novamexicana]|uniref:putative sodium/calcium exchanger 7 n=1 Tax=Drosophila novamexicana TaxID=47314 RepID=UPI0011E599CA|nr:putative sodium/calcium exchanger 7 [Drosophila novamexicana]